MLQAWRARQRQERRAWGAAWADSGAVFTREDGAPLHPGYLTGRFERLARRAGLPPIRLHDLRHGAASLTYRAARDLKAVQALLGHTQISLTADVYTLLFEDAEREAAEAAAALVPRAARILHTSGSAAPVEEIAARTKPQVKPGGAGGTRTHGQGIMSPLL